MAYLREFEIDIFISYAGMDDDQYPGETVGWVTQLQADLAQRVRVYLGTEVTIWRDSDVGYNKQFTTQILNRLSKTAIFVAVISPSYFRQEWTIRELKAFVEGVGGLLFSDSYSRIFKVEKLPVPHDALPPEIQGTRSYRFYLGNPAQPSRVRELRPFLGAEYSRSYFQQMDELVKDIATRLREMAQPDQTGSAGPTVRVVETTSRRSDVAMPSAEPASPGRRADERLVASADVIVSYTSSDRDWADWIAKELQALGHRPLFDEWEAKGGDDINPLAECLSPRRSTGP